VERKEKKKKKETLKREKIEMRVFACFPGKTFCHSRTTFFHEGNRVFPPVMWEQRHSVVLFSTRPARLVAAKTLDFFFFFAVPWTLEREREREREKETKRERERERVATSGRVNYLFP
jgi:hypothetical protein